MLIRSFFSLFFPNTVTVTKFGAHRQWKTWERKKRYAGLYGVCTQVQFFCLFFFFLKSRSRCPTARAADSTRLWMCRVRETLPYHICQEQLKPDLSPCQHRRRSHSVLFRGRGDSLGTAGRSAPSAVFARGFSHLLSFFLNKADCRQLCPGQRCPTCGPRARSGLDVVKYFLPCKQYRGRASGPK